jgi:hypothetical protein
MTTVGATEVKLIATGTEVGPIEIFARIERAPFGLFKCALPALQARNFANLFVLKIY